MVQEDENLKLSKVDEDHYVLRPEDDVSDEKIEPARGEAVFNTFGELVGWFDPAAAATANYDPPPCEETDSSTSSSRNRILSFRLRFRGLIVATCCSCARINGRQKKSR